MSYLIGPGDQKAAKYPYSVLLNGRRRPQGPNCMRDLITLVRLSPVCTAQKHPVVSFTPEEFVGEEAERGWREDTINNGLLYPILASSFLLFWLVRSLAFSLSLHQQRKNVVRGFAPALLPPDARRPRSSKPQNTPSGTAITACLVVSLLIPYNQPL